METAVRAGLRRHLLLLVYQGGAMKGYRVLAAARELIPFARVLGAMAVAAEPALADAPWELAVRAGGAGMNNDLLLDAHLLEGERAGRLLATMRLPLATFQPLACGVAHAVGIPDAKGCQWGIVPVADDHPILARWRSVQEDDDFELIEPAGAGPLRLPHRFRTSPPPGPRRVVAAADGFVRCVFERAAFEQFLAASADCRVERGWALAGRNHVAEGRCWVVVEQLVELPAAEAGPQFLVTHGRDFREAHALLGPRNVGYAHLHPREADGRRIGPVPSGNDTILAWNFQVVCEQICCFPIALFNSPVDASNQEVAACAFGGGLTRCQLEVIQ